MTARISSEPDRELQPQPLRFLGPERDAVFFGTAQSPRVYEWMLGGCENYEADRDLAHALLEVADWVKTSAQLNRDFQVRSYTWCREQGVRQYLELGCGYPHHPVLYDVLGRQCRVVYVDRDPGVLAHARTDLDQDHDTTVVGADVLAMDELLNSDALRQAIDPSQPVAVFLGDVLPWCPDDSAVDRAMAALRSWMPPGSFLVLTHFTDEFTPGQAAAVAATYAAHGVQVRPRSREQIAALFGDFVHQGPGLCATGQWHRGSPQARRPPEGSAAFAGIAMKPTAQGRNA
ncbi:SAM-dependent methyltransferase [Streptomyces sp. MMBL 11-1]|uniref:SAM-dependent methyltransferase n=1 Tax=Streptomyces sp. MMBL 11-1 TaxID=3026420 RepID=UPI00235E92F2|nr:SAM-dependent methyltransferase [Streptomyces sp. MMBL 11-1]